MDKQSFTNYLKTISMDPDTEKAVMSYVNSHDFGDKMVDDVIAILEFEANLSDKAADELNNVIDKMESFRDDMEDSIDTVEAKDAEIEDEYITGAISAMDEDLANLNKTPADTSTPAPVTAAPATAVEVSTPAATVTVTAPVTTPAPATYAPNAPIVQTPPVSEPLPTGPMWGNVPVQPVVTAQVEPAQTSAPQPAPFPKAPVSY